MKTLDLDEITQQADNIFEATVILSKRARQISARQKAELDDRLAYFEGFGSDVENIRMLEEQARVSMEYETKPKPTELAVREMQRREIYFRKPGEE
ncbi:MAG: DNA-directed RNA polymerase subunit omega [Rhodothermales bacterium]